MGGSICNCFLADCSLVSDNANALLAASNNLELNSAVGKSEQGVVRSDADIHAGMNVGTALSDNNIAGNNYLTVSLLNAKTLGFAVPTVFGRTNALLVSEEL